MVFDTNRKAVSLFSGIGGFCYGVELSGFKVLSAVESDRYAAENYRINFPRIPLFEGNVSDFLSGNTISVHKKKYNLNSPVDLLFGGPPCQGYSQIGPRDPADPRNELYLELIRIAKVLKPRLILIENVPNMILMKNGMFRDRIIRALKNAGYKNIGLRLFSADEYGVPQKRKRVFILAADPSVIKFPCQDALELAETSLKKPTVSVHQAINDLPKTVVKEPGLVTKYRKINNISEYQNEMRLDTDGVLITKNEKQLHLNRTNSELGVHNHHTKEIQQKRLNLIKLLKPGAKANSLPKDVWDNARPEKWRRFNGNDPAHTLMAQMHRDLSEWIHPDHDRWITVREAMRLQSFHDGFVLYTSEWQQLKQIGNAVPPLLGRVVALASHYLLDKLEGNESPFLEKGQIGLFEECYG